MPRSASSQSLDPSAPAALDRARRRRLHRRRQRGDGGVGRDLGDRRRDRAVRGRHIRHGDPRRASTGPDAGMSPPDVDPRIERSRAVILEATLDELADVGYGAFTVEGVARRAGVSKATVYRHWDGKLELVADAVGRSSNGAAARHRRPPGTDRRHAARHRRAARRLAVRGLRAGGDVGRRARRRPARLPPPVERRTAGVHGRHARRRPAMPGTSIPMSTPACSPSCSWRRSSSGG